MEIWLLIVGMIIFTAMSAFFSASETALFSMSSISLKMYQRHSDARKRLIAKLLSKPRELLVSILIMNIFVNILVQNMASNLFHNFSGWSLKVGVPLVVTLLFGEIIPKSLALQNNAWLSYHVAPVISTVQRLLGPLRSMISTTATYLYRVVFFFLKKEQSISKEELRHVLRTSEEYGVLHAEEAKLVNGYIELQEDTVKELMRPREDVLFYETKEPISQLIHLFSERQCSRVPISTSGLDSIQGILTVPQYFQFHDEIKTPDDLLKYMSKPFFVPETTPAKTLLRQLREKDEEMAIVVDEYGSITGLITEEDLVEVVVGPIKDRRDEKSLFTRAGQNIIIASGKFELDDFAEVFGKELHSGSSMVTIGGWLMEQLGDIPKSGTKHVAEGFLFHVLAADPNRVRRVYIRKLSNSPKKSKEGWNSG